jgi:hypothetical protein
MVTSGASVLLWLRPDLARDEARAYWAGPHSRLAAMTRGVLEYRQHHFSAESRGAWPQLAGVETAIAEARRVDGTPEVTFEHPWSALVGGPLTRVRNDEQNVFARTLFHLTGPRGGRWLKSGYGASVGHRVVVLVRRRGSTSTFKEFVNGALAAALDRCEGIVELRTQTFLPFVRAAWNTPGVAHDYPRQERFGAAIILGASGRPELEAALATVNGRLGDELRRQVAALHAYDVEQTYAFRVDGRPNPAPDRRT